jgi:hypothetical protein
MSTAHALSSIACAMADAAPLPAPVPAALCLVAAALAIVLVRAALLIARPKRALVQGRYVQARAAADRLASSWLRVFSGIHTGAAWVRAVALHLEGDLEGSLASVTHLPSSLRRVIEAANLLLLDRDPEEAARLLEQAHSRAPEDRMLYALALKKTGRNEEAARIADDAALDASADPNQAAMFHYLRALVTSGDPTPDLEQAANAPLPSIYATRARLQLQAPVEREPSSLAPQVVATARSLDREGT